MSITCTATPDQVRHIVSILDANQLHGGAYERLWAACEAADIDFRTPGDGTPMDAGYAVGAIEWLEGHGYAATRAAAPVITYRKTREGEWVAFGPAVAFRPGEPVITVTKRDGTTETRRVERLGNPFTVDGKPHLYAHLAPRETPPGTPADSRPLPDVPAGYYAVPSATGDNDLDFWRVDRPTEGPWAGRVFVKRVIGGRADQSVRRIEARSALEAIAEFGPVAAGARYGRELGQCGRCNRHLTDEVSRQRGIGPDCWEMIHG
jgi:hypothetical protein